MKVWCKISGENPLLCWCLVVLPPPGPFLELVTILRDIIPNMFLAADVFVWIVCLFVSTSCHPAERCLCIRGGTRITADTFSYSWPGCDYGHMVVVFYQRFWSDTGWILVQNSYFIVTGCAAQGDLCCAKTIVGGNKSYVQHWLGFPQKSCES